MAGDNRPGVRFQPGPTGEFPEGKLGEGDQGAIRTMLGHDPANNVVIFEFGSAVRWIAFGPNQARQIASLLLKHARELDGRGPIVQFGPEP